MGGSSRAQSLAPGPERARVVVVLVRTTHPGNLGAAARAMKAMGLGELRLVRPSRFPSAQATERAAGADDLLYHARVFDSLADALADTRWAVATTARSRRLDWPTLTPRAAAVEALHRAATGTVAVVFGRERSGLSNAELDRCQAMVRIPTDPGFRSLNLASAVQILAYELRGAALDSAAAGPASGCGASLPWADPAELEGLFAHLESTLIRIGYLDPDKPRLLMRRLRRLFNRARLERSELNILRGILRAVQETARGTARDG